MHVSQEELQREKGTQCDSSNQIDGTYTAGQNITCWRPAEAKTVDDLKTFYDCGNDGCIKVIDPSGEQAVAMGWAVTFLVMGGVFLGCGLPFFIGLLCFVIKERKKEKASSSTELDPPAP